MRIAHTTLITVKAAPPLHRSASEDIWPELAGLREGSRKERKGLRQEMEWMGVDERERD